MRVIVRRERPHPGAQLTFSDIHGYRFQTFATNTTVGQLAALEARHRAHARVEDRIRCGKDTGYGRLPSRHFAINAVWLQLALTAADLLAWTQNMLLDGELAAAEPKKLRYRLLHVAAQLTRGQRNTYIRIQQSWPWAEELAAAFERLRLIPTPTRPAPAPSSTHQEPPGDTGRHAGRSTTPSSRRRSDQPCTDRNRSPNTMIMGLLKDGG
jgi:hypothetical protein